MDSTYLDIFILTVLFLSAIRGFNEGFVSESKFLIALLFSVFISSKHLYLAKDILNEFFKIPPSLIESISIFVSFVSVLVIVYSLSLILQFYILRSGSLSVYDRLLGLLFVFAKAFVIISIILYVGLMFVKPSKDVDKFLKNSMSYGFLYKTGDFLIGRYVYENSVESFVDGMINEYESDAKNTISDEIKNTFKPSDNKKNVDSSDEGFLDNFKDVFLK